MSFAADTLRSSARKRTKSDRILNLAAHGRRPPVLKDVETSGRGGWEPEVSSARSRASDEFRRKEFCQQCAREGWGTATVENYRGGERKSAHVCARGRLGLSTRWEETHPAEHTGDGPLTGTLRPHSEFSPTAGKSAES